jgi:hypothetical protein
MATFTKEFLTGTGDGTGLKLAQTVAGSAETIHTADTTAKDEIHLWAFNSDTSDRLVTIMFGATTDPDDYTEFTVPTQDGWYPIIPGFILSGDDIVKAFAETANVITINGFVNRIT